MLLLGLATARLGSRAVQADRESAARAVARVVLAVDPDRRGAALDAAIGRGGVVGARVEDGERSVARGEGRGVEIVERSGRALARVWVAPSERSLPGLLFLYVGITAAAILLFTYVVLTRSIVRPVEELTRASERLARSVDHDVRVPVRGAFEIARLAVAFNAMQRQLGAERAELRERLSELERTTEELVNAQRSLVRSEKMASVGRLAAGIAHEIGNPLSAILGLVELVEGGDLSPEDEREFLRRVRKETERIHRIIRELLDFARTGPAVIDRNSSCDLAEVVEDAVRLVAPQKDLRQLTLERRLAPDAPRARGDGAKLTQVVLNLLLNAADAIGGEGSIRIEVGPSADGAHVELAVSDSGPGIPDEIKDHLFEPFVTTKPAGQGTGLGLAVCHTIVDQLGGTIAVERAPEGGARFVVRIPASR